MQKLFRKKKVLNLILIVFGIFLIYSFQILVSDNQHVDGEDGENKYNIIFIETNEYRDWLNTKQICAIESAAKHNPNARLIVKSLNAKIDIPEIILTYPNIEFSIINLDHAFSDTPLFEWWKSGIVKNTTKHYTRFAHLSDALRYLFVYEYGGFYSDLDTITLKSFEPLRKYFGFVYNLDHPKSVLANGFLHFSKYHPLLLDVLKNIPKSYKPNVWSSIGPMLLQPLVQQYCNVTSIDKLMPLNNTLPETMSNEEEKSDDEPKTIYTRKTLPCGITVLPYYITYPYSYGETYQLFRKSGTVEVKKIMHSYSIHFFGLLSDIIKIKWNEYTIYELFASINCPITHKSLRPKFEYQDLF